MENNSHKTSSINDCKIYTFDTHHHENGNLSVVENGQSDFPFDVKRVYYIYDVPGGAERGGHSHYNCHRFIIAVSGSFDVVLDDGKSKTTVTLNRSNKGLHIIPGIWIELNNFSSGSVCLSLASDYYDEKDYIRDYKEFINLTKDKEQK